MHVGITGGSGFIGQHLCSQLAKTEHQVSILSRGVTPVQSERVDSVVQGSVTDPSAVASLVAGCDAIVHLAGINYERGTQSYQAVHVDGTQTVIDASLDAAINQFIGMSYLRARPSCGSGYLESKWACEELIRAAPLSGTVLKPPAVFGPGDQLLTHLARWIRTLPILPAVGLGGRDLRPLAVEDLVTSITDCLESPESWPETVALLGPESVRLRTLGRRIGQSLGRRTLSIPTPPVALSIGSHLQTKLLNPPIITPAGVRMINEGMTSPAPAELTASPPSDWTPQHAPTVDYIDTALNNPSRYGIGDLRLV